MIDTDKYEGHTPAPWVWMEWNTWLAGGKEDGFDGKFLVQRPTEVADEDKVDGLLMADAPLLLQEVKRYKQVFDRAIECALNDNAEQAMQFLLNMDYCLDDEEKVTDKNRHKYTWVNGEWRNEE